MWQAAEYRVEIDQAIKLSIMASNPFLLLFSLFCIDFMGKSRYLIRIICHLYSSSY